MFWDVHVVFVSHLYPGYTLDDVPGPISRTRNAPKFSYQMTTSIYVGSAEEVIL